MPRDAEGGFHVSGLRPVKGKLPLHEKPLPKEPKLGEKGESKPESHGEGGSMTEVHDHGDGTFHTMHNGEQTDHESIGHMHAHLSKTHGAPGEKHFHAHHDGMFGHSHSVESGQEPQHQEGDTPEMHQHLDAAMGESQQPMQDEGEPSLSGFGG